MCRIKILSGFLANQIAAGEVVQSPESVVKELVENAIDAEATNIQIILKKSGKVLIHIVDNGFGMDKQDLFVATLMHTTSKLFTSEQLNDIRTFGFRGEALAAISSVSLLEIRSRTNDSSHGWRLVTEPQKELEIEPMNLDVGTQVLVQNLFYNTPARRKFLKSDATEFRKIQETLYKLALSNNNIEFTFYHDDKLIFNIKKNTLEQRLVSLFGRTYSHGKLLKVDKKFHGVHIHGYVGQPQLARQVAPAQYFFLNKRSINSKSLSYAVFSAFEHIVSKNLKPFFVINLDVDYKEVDVNVHPQKTEVRFEDEKYMFSCVKGAITDAMKLGNIVSPSININNLENENIDGESLIIDKTTGEIITQEDLKYSISYSSPTYTEKIKKLEKNNNIWTAPSYKQHQKLPPDISNYLYSEKTNPQENFQNIQHRTDFNFNKKSLIYNNIWQLHNKYILLETIEGVLAIDQHNADERWIYESLVKKINTSQASKQVLLFPIEIDLTQTLLLAVNEIEKELYRIGFEFTYEQNVTDRLNKIIITAQPSELNITNSEHTFVEILEEYLYCQEIKHSSKQEKILASVACKSAIKAGRRLEIPEMILITQRLFECEMPYVCPHGRPIIAECSLSKIDKKFGR